jgi:hypothetical protein
MLLTALLALAAQAATPTLPTLNAMQQGALTCSAAFAVDARAPGGDAERQGREREFFVQALAQIMDETGADREAIVALVGAEAQRLAAQPAQLAQVLPACRSLLDTSNTK